MSNKSDSISLQIQWSRLISIMDEVDVALVRTSFSTIVGETRDFAVILLDVKAHSIAQSQLSSPGFTCSLPSATRIILEQFPIDSLFIGDVLITNDPWICHGHLPDMIVVKPIYFQGKVSAFMAAAAHVSDIGGRLDEFDARDVYEEGLRIPPSKLFERGQKNKQLYDIIEANTRYPRMVIGDIEAIVGAFKIGEIRFNEFIEDYSIKIFNNLSKDILSRSEKAMQKAIQKIPNGIYDCTVYADGYKKLTKIVSSVSVKDDSINVDYTGSSNQRPDASINCVLNNTLAHTIYPLKCSLVPFVPNNEGLFRPINITVPEGSILNTIFPAPVKARSKTSYHIHNAIYGALSKVLPNVVQAGSGSFWSVKCYGKEQDGTTYAVHMLPNGGKGAVIGKDGLSTIAFPANGTITPTEILENGSPLLIIERSLRNDSGGAGKNRGGLGQTIRLTCKFDYSTWLTIRPDKMIFPAPGLEGGQPGKVGELTINNKPLVLEPFKLSSDQVVTMKLPGGGGIGKPKDRDRKMLSRDLEMNYITKESKKYYN